MNKIQREQVSLLQQSIWDLEKARDKIQMAIGASDIGKIYIRNINELIENVQDDIDNI